MTVITDISAGYFTEQGTIDAVIVGANRIAANGGVADKFGTCAMAVVAEAQRC